MERDRIHQIWGAVVLAIGVLAAFVVLLALHIDSSPLLGVIGLVVTPIITAILITQVRRDTKEIKESVNGHLSTLTSKIPDAIHENGNENGRS